MSDTTIQISKETRDLLKQAKDYPRQTYDDLLRRLARAKASLRQQNQYDKFLHNVQQVKAQELWDNEEDSFWDEI
ncbi:MAG: hypothetical protein ACMXYD_05540 [Candidatus Woesearchaeota archaeon]